MSKYTYWLDLSAVSEEEFEAHLTEVNDQWWVYWSQYPSAVLGSDEFTSADMPGPVGARATLIHQLPHDPRSETWSAETFSEVINDICSLWVQVNPADRVFSCSHELLRTPVESPSLEEGISVLLYVLDRQESATDAVTFEVALSDPTPEGVALTLLEEPDEQDPIAELTREVRKLRKQVALQNASFDVLQRREE